MCPMDFSLTGCVEKKEKNISRFLQLPNYFQINSGFFLESVFFSQTNTEHLKGLKTKDEEIKYSDIFKANMCWP